MKTLFHVCCLSVFLLSGLARSQEAMTPELFRKLVATPGDTNALRSELVTSPVWKEVKCSIILKYQDGKVFKEECRGAAKTIGGNYIVASLDSKFYKQTVYSIVAYDEKAKAVKQWALYGDKLFEAIIVYDEQKKISAWTSSYGEGFLEIGVSSFSEKEETGHTLVYKDGVLFYTRETITRPVNATHSAPAGSKQ